MNMNNDLLIGLVTAALLHVSVFFATVPLSKPHYEVVVAPSALEVSLVKSPPKKIEKLPEPPMEEPPQKTQEPEIFREIPEPEEIIEEPVEEIPEVNVQQGATMDARPLTHYNEPPAYPRYARRKGWQGRVMIEARISKEGKVKTAQITESSGHASLDEEALKAIVKWVFEPAQLFGNPVETSLSIPVIFRLEN